LDHDIELLLIWCGCLLFLQTQLVLWDRSVYTFCSFWILHSRFQYCFPLALFLALHRSSVGVWLLWIRKFQSDMTMSMVTNCPAFENLINLLWDQGRESSVMTVIQTVQRSLELWCVMMIICKLNCFHSEINSWCYAPLKSKHQHPPPRANAGRLTILCARGVGNLICKAFPGPHNRKYEY